VLRSDHNLVQILYMARQLSILIPHLGLEFLIQEFYFLFICKLTRLWSLLILIRLYYPYGISIMLGQRPVSETNVHSFTKDGTIPSTGYLKVLVCTIFENLILVRIGYLLCSTLCSKYFLYCSSNSNWPVIRRGYKV